MQNRKSLIAIMTLGTLLEWAEFSFYGYIAVKMAALFFPASDPFTGVLQTFGIFALGYVMRPFGAILFGHIGDNFGRRSALMASLTLMGCATFAIGCLPSFDQIGLLAPCLLLLFRMLQGMAVSGEYQGAGIFLTENAGKKYPCLAGSWVPASAAAGMVVGCLTAFIVNSPYMPAWAWRVPFLLSGLTCFVAFWLRKRELEANDAPPKPKSDKQLYPFFAVLKQHKKALIFTGAIAAFTCIYFYIGNIFMVAFLQQQVELPLHWATMNALLGETVTMLLIPCMAYLADKTNPYQLYRISLLAAALSCPCIFLLALSGHLSLIALGMILFGISNAAICGPMIKLLYDQFPANLRYTGISFGWSLSAALFSGTAPMLAQYLTIQNGWLMGPSFYVSMMALLTYSITQKWLSPSLVILKPSLQRS